MKQTDSVKVLAIYTKDILTENFDEVYDELKEEVEEEYPEVTPIIKFITEEDSEYVAIYIHIRDMEKEQEWLAQM
jgi:predicted nuclease with TOPRIM domain